MKNILGIGDNFEEQVCHWCKKDLSNHKKLHKEAMKNPPKNYRNDGICTSSYSVRYGFWRCVDFSKTEYKDVERPYGRKDSKGRRFNTIRYDCRGKKV